MRSVNSSGPEIQRDFFGLQLNPSLLRGPTRTPSRTQLAQRIPTSSPWSLTSGPAGLTRILRAKDGAIPD